MISNYIFEQIPNQVNLLVPLATPKPSLPKMSCPIPSTNVPDERTTKPKKSNVKERCRSGKYKCMKCLFYVIMFVLIIKTFN